MILELGNMFPRSQEVLKTENAISQAIKNFSIVESTVFIHDLLRSKSRFSSGQFKILVELGEYGPLSSQLIEEMGYSRSYSRHILQKLEKKGLIEHCGFHYHHSHESNIIYPVKLYRLTGGIHPSEQK